MEKLQEKKEEKITKAKKVKKAIAIVSLIGGLGVATLLGNLNKKCHANEANKSICPITKMKTELFGYEAGLKHQMHDLERYASQLKEANSDDSIDKIYYQGKYEDRVLDYISAGSEVAKTAKIVDGKVVYSAPKDGILLGNKAYTSRKIYKDIEKPAAVFYTEEIDGVTSKKQWTYDGEKIRHNKVEYSAPSGYILEENNDRMVARKYMKAIATERITNGEKSVTYTAPSGYTLSGDICYKDIEPTITTKPIEDTEEPEIKLKKSR